MSGVIRSIGATTYCAGEDVGEQEPHAFRETWVLRVQTLHQTNKRTCAIVRCEERRRVFAAKWIFRMIFDGLREEASMQVEDCCNTR